MKRFWIILLLFPIAVFAQDSTAVDTSPNIGGVDLSTIINVVLVVVTAVFGSIWAIVKSKLTQALNLLKVVVDAVDDNNVTKDELNAIIAAAKKLIGKG